VDPVPVDPVLVDPVLVDIAPTEIRVCFSPSAAEESVPTLRAEAHSAVCANIARA
jgi:hypothetical protein